MSRKELFDEVRPLGYYRAVSRNGGVASAIALAGVFFILHYIFDNYIYGNVLDAIAAMETGFYVVAGVVGAIALVYALTTFLSRKIKGLDTALIALVFADVIVIVQKYLVDRDMQNRVEPLFYFVPLAAAVVLTLVRWWRFDPAQNRIRDTRHMIADAGVKGYYKLMFTRVSTYAAAIITAVMMVAFIVTEEKGWFGFTAVSTAAGQRMYEILIVGAVIAGVFFCVSFVARVINKNVNFCDTIAMNTIVIAIGMLVRLAFAHAIADIVVAIVFAIAAVAMQFILAKRTVNVKSVLYADQPAEVETVSKEESVVKAVADDGLEKRVAETERVGAFLMRNAERTMSLIDEERSLRENRMQAAVQPVSAVTSPDVSELEKRVAETERVNAFLMRNAERTMSLIEEERSLRGGNAQPQQAASVGREAFLMRKAERLESEVEYLMAELGRLRAVVDALSARPVAEPAKEAEPVEEDEQTEYEEFERERESVNWIETEATSRRAKPRFTFDLKLRLADDNVKGFYSDIKNALLSYGMHSRMSRHKENFNKGRNQIARMAINGKTLKVYLAIDPATLDPKIYHHKDVSDKKGVADLPTMINVRSGLAVRKIKALIDTIAEDLVIKPKKYEPVDFASQLTLDGFSTVERKGYGYMVKDSATRAEVDEIPDDFATNAVEYVYADKKAERFIKTKVTLDELSAHFEDGATIDIDAVREKGIASAPNSNWLSVAASDRLGKKFKVYANEYTVSAAKMICVAGGEAFMILQPEN